MGLRGRRGRGLDRRGAPLDARVEMLAEELAASEARLATNENWSVEVAVSALEQEMGELLLEDADPFDTSIWQQLEKPL